MQTFKLTTHDNLILNGYKWISSSDKLQSKSLLIIHGMAEHAKRYDDFAKFLNSKGFNVYAFDIRGHGADIENGVEGLFAKKNGDEKVLNDVKLISEYIIEKEHGKELFIMGHSMGTIFARLAILEFGSLYKGCILTGPPEDPIYLRYIGLCIAYIQCLILGPQSKGKFLSAISIDNYNKVFKGAKTDFDWLSRNEKEVKKYIDDKFCGYKCCAGFFRDLVKAMNRAASNKLIKKIPKDLPIIIFSGEKDATTRNGEVVKIIKDRYSKAKIKKVTSKLYKDARHELINEINKHDVYSDIANFILKN